MTTTGTRIAHLTSTRTDDYLVDPDLAAADTDQPRLVITDRFGHTYAVSAFSVRTTFSGGVQVARLITWSGRQLDGDKHPYAFGQTLAADYPGDRDAFTTLLDAADAAA